VILYSIPSEKIEYKKCNYRFIQVSLILKYNDEENIYKVELSNSAYNYYIANNKLNSKFIGYYLKKHCNIFFDMDEYENINYKISIMDHDINQIVITEKDELIFGENDYKIVKVELPVSNTEKEEEEDEEEDEKEEKKEKEEKEEDEKEEKKEKEEKEKKDSDYVDVAKDSGEKEISLIKNLKMFWRNNF
jgi:hypothetical protein